MLGCYYVCNSYAIPVANPTQEHHTPGTQLDGEDLDVEHVEPYFNGRFVILFFKFHTISSPHAFSHPLPSQGRS